MIRTAYIACLAMLHAVPAAARDLADPAAAFGVRESVQSIAMSPDGSTLVYAQPAPGQGAVLFAVDIASSAVRPVMRADGVRQRLGGCNFVSNLRLVCGIWGITDYEGVLVPVSRLAALDTNGGNIRVLGERDSPDQEYIRTYSGSVIDWLPGAENSVLMMQSFIPSGSTGTRMGRREEGLGVVRVDTSQARSSTVEQPRADAVDFITDGRGQVRIMATRGVRGGSGLQASVTTYHYRPAGSSEWQVLGTLDMRTREGILPLAVDPDLNAAYIFADHQGRTALFRVKLDGTLHRELVASHDQVDIDGLLRIGRRNRVVGATFATDRRQVIYFDPQLRQIAEQLRRALPNLPLIEFIDSSEDEQRLLVWAGSDADPGRYYILDRATRNMNELMLARPELEDVPLAPVRPMTYRAADGTQVPGYLTLPPGREGRNLPAIVMPHGGPSARDEWGFDWLAQYFANRGYAVLQPNFRGSAGYGEGWFRHNGFVSWRTAVGDVNDAARWLVGQGIADPEKLAIVGWSYGGYAALQANVLEPGLFRAVVAVAPVTDLETARNEWQGFSNAANVRDFFGSGPHIRAGSPAQNAAAIRAPVLMFHGDRDRNVGIRQSQLMDTRLRDAGRRSELVVYPGLDHQIDDSAARADMLRRSDAFLREALGIR